jgi:pimeloyl-ACP methyl ester carboxylesterase
MATFVLVHGSSGGGWVWRAVAAGLRAAGHEAWAPTLTGMGERVHLANPAVGLDTHVLDVVNVLNYEDLREVVLVGHSYGGVVITGVAERDPARLAHLVYLDALVPADGQAMVDFYPPAVRAGLAAAARTHGDLRVEEDRAPGRPGAAGGLHHLEAGVAAADEPLADLRPERPRLRRPGRLDRS